MHNSRYFLMSHLKILITPIYFAGSIPDGVIGIFH